MAPRKVVRRAGDADWKGFCRGTEITLTFDEQHYVGSSAFLLASVLNRFFALYASTNSFTQLVIQRVGPRRGVEAMAAYGWRQRRAVAEGSWRGGAPVLLPAGRAPAGDDASPTARSPAEGIDPRREVVRFRSAVRLDFPPGDVEERPPRKVIRPR